MWIVPIKRVTEKTMKWLNGSFAEIDAIQRRSTFMCVVGSGRVPVFVLGWLPPTLISDKNYLWFSPIGEFSLSLSELRQLKKVFTASMRKLSGRFFAEIDPSRKVDVRFAEFMGFKYKSSSITGRAVYEWVK